MRRFLAKMQPRFLANLDQWLLKHHHVVWRTYIHQVLFYALSVASVFFLVGLLMPQNGKDLKIDPVSPILIHEDSSLFLFIISLTFLFWAYLLYKKGLPYLHLPGTLVTLFCFGLGSFISLGITAPAYRLGSIVHTATLLMDKEDIKDIKRNDYYAYGMVLLSEDTTLVDSMPHDSFFSYRQSLFRKLVHQEDLLQDSLIYYRDDLVQLTFPKANLEIITDSNRSFTSAAVYRMEAKRLNLPFLAFYRYGPDSVSMSFDAYIGMRSIQGRYDIIRETDLDSIYPFETYSLALDTICLSLDSISKNVTTFSKVYGQFLMEDRYLSYLSELSDKSYLLDRSYLWYLAEVAYVQVPQSSLLELLDIMNQPKSLHQSHRSYLSGLQYDQDIMNISFDPNKKYLSELQYWSQWRSLLDRWHWSYLSYILKQSYINKVNQAVPEFFEASSNQSYQSYLRYQSFLSGLSYRTDQLDSMKSKLNDLAKSPEIIYPQWYYHYYSQNLDRSKCHHYFMKYSIFIDNGNVRADSSLALDLLYLSRLQELVRSVEHAQLYLRRGIFFRHWKLLLPYVLGIITLFFLTPLLSLQVFFGASILNSIGLYVLGMWTGGFSHEYLASLIIIYSFLLLGCSLWRHRGKVFQVSIHSIYYLLLGILYFTIIAGESDEIFDTSPTNFTLWSSIIASLLICPQVGYLLAFPRRKL